jgi:hypothetical protein
MSTTTPNMGITKPDPGGSIGTWGTETNNSWDVVDSHDHTSGKGVQIPTAGIDVDADLPLNGFAATGVKALDLAPVAASTTTGYSTALYVDSSDNELYWRTSGGVAVKLTLATSLNAALLGGFTGDYGSGGSQANFNSGTSIYNFLRATNHRAFIDSSDIRLFQGTSGITNAVKLRSPNSLAASYDFVFPTALPGSTSLLRLTSAGQAETTRDPSVDTVTTTGAVTAGGLVTASAGVTAASGQHFTVQGAGRYKHGTFTRVMGGGVAYGVGLAVGTGASIELNATTDLAYWNVDLDVGKRLTVVRAFVTDNATGTTTIQIELFTKVGSSLVSTGGSATSAGSGANQTLTITQNNTLAASTALVLRASVSAANLCSVHRVEFDYDHP